ncbi:MAG: hypothetical protein M3R06_10230, partial [Chloroflexota bacterium]|nr:hypothetical protein [Chloroflexota bacterium]
VRKERKLQTRDSRWGWAHVDQSERASDYVARPTGCDRMTIPRSSPPRWSGLTLSPASACWKWAVGTARSPALRPAPAIRGMVALDISASKITAAAPAAGCPSA